MKLKVKHNNENRPVKITVSESTRYRIKNKAAKLGISIKKLLEDFSNK